MDKAGIIPYFIDKDQVYVYLMIPSDPHYGGTAPQIAKGQIDLNESPEQAAIREGEEELGLRRTNIINISYCCEQKLQGMHTPGYPLPQPYKLIIFIAKIISPRQFSKPHYETKRALWISERDIHKIRSNQRALVQEAISKIKSKKESFTFAEFLENTENITRMIDPETNKPYRHRRLLDKLDVIMKDEVAKGVPEDNIWVNFAHVPRLSAEPHRAYTISKETPHGIFAYPLQYFLDQRSVPYAQDRPYCIAFKSKVPIWDIGLTKKRSDNQWAVELSDSHSIEEVDFPEKDKLIKIADDLDIILLPIVQKVADDVVVGSTYQSANEVFIYRVLEKMAKVWAEKDKRKNLSWPMRWNKLLRMMGKSNVVDLQGSGSVHTYEPTQGAFLNPKDLEVIEIIVNKPGVSQETVLGAFDKTSRLRDPKHSQQFSREQRVNRTIYNYQHATDDDIRRQMGLMASARDRIREFMEEFRNWRMLGRSMFKGKLIIFRNRLKSYLKSQNLFLKEKLNPELNALRIDLQTYLMDSHSKYDNILKEIYSLLSELRK